MQIYRPSIQTDVEVGKEGKKKKKENNNNNNSKNARMMNDTVINTLNICLLI